MQKIDSLIKVGGSLISQTKEFGELLEILEETSKKNKIVLTTGSKDISDIIRDRMREILGISLSVENHIDTTWKSRDIVSQAFCDLNDRFIPVNNLEDINKVLKRGEIPIIIQYELLKKLQPFPLIRGLSTDTTSAFFSNEIGTKRFIKLTNVDGVLRNIKDDKNIIKEISTTELKKMGKTCICEATSGYLEKINKICYVINGRKITNLLDFLDNNTGLYTKVIPK